MILEASERNINAMHTLKRNSNNAPSQVLIATLYAIPSGMFFGSLRNIGRIDSDGGSIGLLVLIALSIILGAGVLPFWAATAFHGVILSTQLSLLYLWISHRISNSFEYAYLVAYAGLGASVLVLIALLFCIDSRKKTVRPNRTMITFLLLAGTLAPAAATFMRTSIPVGFATMMFYMLPCFLQVFAVVRDRRTVLTNRDEPDV